MTAEQTREDVGGPLLVVEVGTAITRVTLVDVVDNVYRMIARSESWTTLAAPGADVTGAIMEAIATITETTGRRLVRDGRLIQPLDQQGEGVRALVVSTSAAGTMPVLICALAAEQSARAASHAVRSTYTRIIRNFALDEAGVEQGDWLNRQVIHLAQSGPAAILLTGGVEGGALSALQRLAGLVRLIARQQTPPAPVIFAGNSAAEAMVKELLEPATSVTVVPNLRPNEAQEQLEPARGELRKLYAEQYAAKLFSDADLRQLPVAHVSSVAEDLGLMTRFIHEQSGRNILTLDMGATTAVAILCSAGQYAESVWGGCGTQAGALDVLQEAGAEAICRWLPYELSASELENRLLNRLLSPPHVPPDLDSLLLDHALLREGLRLVYAALRDQQPAAPFNLVFASGAVARAPRPGLAALTLLDALEWEGASLPMTLDLYLDSLQLLSVSGALARVDADAAVCMVEHDLLKNGPLATVVVLHGQLTGEVAEVELTPAGSDTPLRAVVEAGTLVRLPLPRGRRATLQVRPVAGVAVGGYAAGTTARSEPQAIVGSTLGLIVDARPRPLAMPADPAERRRMLLGHLRTLDALPTASAYAAELWRETSAAPLAGQPEEVAVEAVPVLVADEKPDNVATESNGTPAGSEPFVADGAAAPKQDVLALRKDLVVETKPKRGLFRSKKGESRDG